MTVTRFLKLCEGAANFSDEEFEVWVRGEQAGEAKPIVAISISGVGVLLSAGEEDHGGSCLRMKALISQLREAAKRYGAGNIALSRCYVWCEQSEDGGGYFDVVETAPAVEFDDKRVIFQMRNCGGKLNNFAQSAK